jgi:sporulation and spore germination protein
MTRGMIAGLVATAAIGLLIGVVLVLVTIGVRRASSTSKPPVAESAAAPGAGPAEPAMLGRKIKARLFYVSEDGTRLTGVEREVLYGDGPAAQAQLLINAQLAPVAAPLVSAVPPGTTLRAIYLNTARGEAYVDLSREAVTAHSGGSLDELLTIYTIVNTLTSNLPAVTSVQVLVDGKEIDTLAGHVDLRRPLAKNLALVE